MMSKTVVDLNTNPDEAAVLSSTDEPKYESVDEASSQRNDAATEPSKPANITLLDFLNKVDPEIADIVVQQTILNEDDHDAPRSFHPRGSSSHQMRTDMPDNDYNNDPIAALKLATDLAIHRASKFFDKLQGSRQEYARKIKTFSRFVALSAQERLPSLDSAKSSEIKTKRAVAQSIQMLQPEKRQRRRSEEYESGASDWSTERTRNTILTAIEQNAVPKAKKSKKKKKKKKKSEASRTSMEDVLTPEEAYLDYQIKVAEEKLEEHLFVYQAAAEEGRIVNEKLAETQKRYDQEMQACKGEFTQDEAELSALEDQWRRSIRQTEEDIAVSRAQIYSKSTDLRSKISEKKSIIKTLQQDIGIWNAFREGEMVRNRNKIAKLENSIRKVDDEHKRFLKLTESEIRFSEEQAEKTEKQNLEELCEAQIIKVRNTLPSLELQEIENNSTLLAEATALEEIHNQLDDQTTNLQKKIVHQAATSQILLESINQSLNTNLTKTRLFAEWDIWDKIGSTTAYDAESLYDKFSDNDEVQRLSGGLSVIGKGLFSRHNFSYLATHQSSVNPFTTQDFSSIGARSLEIPRIFVHDDSADTDINFIRNSSLTAGFLPQFSMEKTKSDSFAEFRSEGSLTVSVEITTDDT